jgi:hypothetical protein
LTVCKIKRKWYVTNLYGRWQVARFDAKYIWYIFVEYLLVSKLLGGGGANLSDVLMDWSVQKTHLILIECVWTPFWLTTRPNYERLNSILELSTWRMDLFKFRSVRWSSHFCIQGFLASVHFFIPVPLWNMTLKICMCQIFWYHRRLSQFWCCVSIADNPVLLLSIYKKNLMSWKL